VFRIEQNGRMSLGRPKPPTKGGSAPDKEEETLRPKRVAKKTAFEHNGSRIQLLVFRKLERSDVDEELLKWFKQDRSDNVPVSGALLMTTSVLPKF